MTQEEWQAIRDRDPAYDGKLFYSVKRSHVVCRPSCPRRKLQSREIIIFHSLDEALGAGYHVCSRCRPDLAEWRGARGELADSAEKLVREHYKEKFSLDAVANALHVDKSYLLRTFKLVKGTTLLAFHNQVRCEAAKKLLQDPELSVSSVSSSVGFVSSAHFSQVFRKYYHMTPSEYRASYLSQFD